ncbi:MAG: hypothetical protein K0R90_1472, partial [Oscillospiraceae bacterium]|nr:hypothetical protein [Oscillospiraceae bacterium]
MEKGKILIKNVFSLIIISAVIFMFFALFIYIVPNGMGYGSDLKTQTQSVSTWKFVWAKNANDLEKDITKWKIANGNAQIYKPLSEQYIRLSRTVTVDEQKPNLQIITAANPIKVKINGQEVYNNGYGTSNFVGNNVNNIKLTDDNINKQVDVFMKVPFGFAFSAGLLDSDTFVNVSSVSRLMGFSTGFTLIMLGIIVMILAAFFSIGNSKVKRIIVSSSVLLLLGVSVVFSQISMHFDLLTSPWIFKSQILVSMVITTVIMMLSFKIIEKWNFSSKMISLASFLYAAVFTFYPDQNVSKWLLIAYPVLLVIFIFVFVLKVSQKVLNKVAFSRVIFVEFLIFLYMMIFDFLNLIFGLQSYMIKLQYIGAAVFAVTTTWILIKRALYLNIRLDERSKQIERDTGWIKRVVDSCTEIFSQQDQKEFFIKTAKSLKSFLESETEDNQATEYDEISINIAVKSADSFVDVYSEGGQKCDYLSILKYAEKHNMKQVFFGKTYMDVILYHDGQPIAILHFQGMTNGLSDQIKNIINIFYSNISVAIDNMRL